MATERAAASFPNSPVEVLLVEDNLGDVRLMREMLKQSRLSINLSVASDGEEALAFMRQENGFADAPRPDLVLLDLDMPKMDGRTVLSEMRKDPNLTFIPVVIFTGSENENDVLTSYKLHASAYVNKPLEVEQFARVVKSIEDFWMRVAKLPGRTARKAAG
jgi:two-component system, chemotaxis family, response regulator Rcp1